MHPRREYVSAKPRPVDPRADQLVRQLIVQAGLQRRTSEHECVNMKMPSVSAIGRGSICRLDDASKTCHIESLRIACNSGYLDQSPAALSGASSLSAPGSSTECGSPTLAEGIPEIIKLVGRRVPHRQGHQIDGAALTLTLAHSRGDFGRPGMSDYRRAPRAGPNGSASYETAVTRDGPTVDDPPLHDDALTIIRVTDTIVVEHTPATAHSLQRRSLPENGPFTPTNSPAFGRVER